MMLFVLILVSGAVAGDSSAELRRFLCGWELATALSLYCDNEGPAPEDTTGFDLSKTQVGSSAAPRMVPERFSHKLRRAVEIRHHAGALVETCCVRPCLISELLDHC